MTTTVRDAAPAKIVVLDSDDNGLGCMQSKRSKRQERNVTLKKKLLYRVVPHNGGIVFASPDRAVHIAKIHTAISSSKTWGEFRSAMPMKEYSAIIHVSIDDMGERRPKSTDVFSGDAVPGWSDGDYPPWLQAEMDAILPVSILKKFGVRETTAVNGSFWLLPEKNLTGVCAALEALGWELERDQNLPFH